MNVDKDAAESGDLVFRKEFANVAEGSHQYKIRVGEDHWLLDETKDSGMLESLSSVTNHTEISQQQMSKATATTSSMSSPRTKPTPQP